MMSTRHSDSEFEMGVDEPSDFITWEPPTWCVACGREVRMAVAEKAAVISQCSRRKIYRWIEDGDLHFVEVPDGEVYVCGRSLRRKLESLNTSTGELPPISPGR